MIMRKTARLVAGLLGLALWPGAAQGQSPELQEAYDRFSVWYEKDYYEEALPFAEEAIRLSHEEFGPDHPITTTLLVDLAGYFDDRAALYQAQGRFAEAEALYRRSLAIHERVLGPGHPQSAASLERLAALFDETGRKEQAADLAARARSIRVGQAPDD